MWKQSTTKGDGVKNERIMICVNAEQKAAIKKLADQEGVSISAYLIQLALPEKK